MATSTAVLDRGPGLINLCIGIIVLSVVSVGLRFWSRAVLPNTRAPGRSGLWWDDWTALATLPFIIGLAAIVIGWVQYDGLGKPPQAVTAEQQANGLVWLFALYFPHPCGLTFPKLSALFFYERVFTSSHGNRYFRWALIATGVFVIGILIFSVLAAIFQCDPVPKAWNPSLPGHCVNEVGVYYAQSILTAIADVTILVLPLPLLWKVQMPVSRKLLSSGVFVCGYGVTVISIGRLVAAIEANSPDQKDPTGASVTVLYWLLLEAPLGVFCVCLPPMFSLARVVWMHGPSAAFKRFSPHTVGQTYASREIVETRRTRSIPRAFDDADDTQELHTMQRFGSHEIMDIEKQSQAPSFSMEGTADWSMAGLDQHH